VACGSSSTCSARSPTGCAMGNRAMPTENVDHLGGVAEGPSGKCSPIPTPTLGILARSTSMS
jgi:hypothetical protein